MVMEQLLHTLPSEIKVWVTERKPKTSMEAAEMADNYLRARKQQKYGHQQERKPWANAKGPREGGKRMDSSPKPVVSDGGTHRSTYGQRETRRGSIATIVERRVTFPGTVPATGADIRKGRGR